MNHAASPTLLANAFSWVFLLRHVLISIFTTKISPKQLYLFWLFTIYVRKLPFISSADCWRPATTDPISKSQASNKSGCESFSDRTSTVCRKYKVVVDEAYFSITTIYSPNFHSSTLCDIRPSYWIINKRRAKFWKGDLGNRVQTERNYVDLFS